jgi:hypothetical protein
MPGDAADFAGAQGALDLEIDGSTGELAFDAAGGIVRGAGGELSVSADEVSAARERPGELVGALQSGGLQAAISTGDGVAEDMALADTQLALWNELGGAPLAVVMDTTTYHHARQALRGDIRAHNLLDLNLLAVAAVFFDYVFIQPDLIQPETEEADFTRIVYAAPGEDAHIKALHRLAVDECKRSRADLQEAWRTFLRDPSVELDLAHAPMGPEDDRYYRWSVQDLPSDRGHVVDDVTQQTVRAAFNDRVAGALQLPYLASSVRLPVSRELIRSHRELLFMLRRVLGHQPGGGATEAGPFTPPEPMYAPLMLGVLLDCASKAGSGGSVMDCLASLRERMSDVRAFLRDHPERADWHERPQALLREVSGRLNADLKKTGVAKAQNASLVATEGATGLLFGPIASLAVKVLQALLPKDAAANAARQIFRREILLLSDVTREATQIATVEAQIEKVWGRPMDSATRKTLDRIANLNADPLISIGHV